MTSSTQPNEHKTHPDFRLCTTADIAQLFGVCATTVRNWVKNGDFPKPIKAGKVWYFRTHEVEAWFRRPSPSMPTAQAGH